MRHAVHLPDVDPSAGEILVEGDEARHALRVKRVREGDRVTILSGRGLRLEARAIEARRSLRLQVFDKKEIAQPSPRVEVHAAPPKGPRASDLVDALSQVGAAAWIPLETAFGVESISPSRRDRLERVAVESLKQCERAWLLEIGDVSDLAGALSPGPGVDLVIADAAGEAYEPAPGTDAVRLLIGPEGGWREDELESARAAGARACRFGPHVMRIELAAPVATAVILDRRRGPAWNEEGPGT